MTHHGQILHANQLDPGNWGNWGDQAGQLITALGGAVVVREIIKQVFGRANKGDDNAVIARADLRAQVADLVKRVDTLQARVEERDERINALFAQNAELRAENRGLRDRYHRLINWIAQQPALPTPPDWLYERAPGPTESTDWPPRRRRTTDQPEPPA